MRLILHECDNSQAAKDLREALGKTHVDCAGELESQNYFERTMIGINSISKELSINETFN